jgi:ATP-dependent RNA helicase DDX19/DBP5
MLSGVDREVSDSMTVLPDFKVYFSSSVSRGQTIDDHIVIGTPGTVQDWTTRFKVFDLKKIRVFVLDEADVMIATQGHQDQSIRVQR